MNFAVDFKPLKTQRDTENFCGSRFVKYGILRYTRLDAIDEQTGKIEQG